MNRHFTRFLFFSFCITIFLASCEDTPSARYQVEGHEDAVIGKNCQLGPFARVRPGTELKDSAKLGNFVEIKKSIVLITRR